MAVITLNVSFDINQVSEALDWLYLKDGEPIVSDDGKYTGVLSFDRGDTFIVTVHGKSYQKRLQGLQIVDCHLVNVPFLNSAQSFPEQAGQYPMPSPYFDPKSLTNGATTCLVPPGDVGIASGDAGEMSWTSPVILTYANRGRWETSFIVTVAIKQASGMSYRVFSFDPESQVGSGSNPDPDPGPGNC